MHPEEIDWNGMWNEKLKKLGSQPETGNREERWDQMADIFRLWSEHDEYPVKILGRIPIEHEWSVLDIGCGMGIIAIAAAIRARQVTALDISSRMLEILKQEARNRHLGNIRYLHRSWESTRVGTDIVPHDVVIASRTIIRTGNLQESLEKIDQSAIRYAYVTAWGGEEHGFHQDFREVLGYATRKAPEEMYIYNILHRMGIHPNVEQIECRNTIVVQDPQQALQCYQVLFELSSEVVEIARAYLQDHLVRKKDGTWVTPETWTTWSLIWWKKKE
jgi:predicted TPR repeat methyltransferase